LKQITVGIFLDFVTYSAANDNSFVKIPSPLTPPITNHKYPSGNIDFFVTTPRIYPRLRKTRVHTGDVAGGRPGELPVDPTGISVYS
jgi:hypothetical protein